MLIKYYSNGDNERAISQAVRVLTDGGIVIYPTDSVYAIGCHALKERAVEKVCRIKGINPAKNRLSVICYDLSAISQYARISNSVFKLMKKNLPGPFTFILPGLSTLPKVFRGRGSEVGIRMPDHPFLRQLLERLDAPILTASLPPVGEEMEYTTNADLIEETFGQQVDMVIDGGEGVPGVTTVVDCTGDEPEIVRQGKGILQ